MCMHKSDSSLHSLLTNKNLLIWTLLLLFLSSLTYYLKKFPNNKNFIQNTKMSKDKFLQFNGIKLRLIFIYKNMYVSLVDSEKGKI